MSAIYEVCWDKLAANKYNKLFRQCVLVLYAKFTHPENISLQ